MFNDRNLIVTHAPATLALMAVLSASAVMAQDSQNMPPAELVAEMQSGGNVIYIRHGRTETDYADQISAEMGNCASQRMLSEAGWHDAKAIGAAFKALSIPVGDVISSEYCRAWQTADLAFGTYSKNPDLNFEPAEEYTDAQTAAMRDRTVPHLSAIPANGNTVLVGHDDPFEAATGIYPEPMGVVFVLRPKGDGNFDVLGSITPDAWANLK